MLGFIGLGTMGAPMCRNLAARSGQGVSAYDSDLDALAQMDESGVKPAESIREVAERADIVFLSLPGGPQVNAVCLGAGSLLTHLKPGSLVVDLSTSPANLARDLHARFTARGIEFADAPVSGTREAAARGALTVHVGATPGVFSRIKPLLESLGTEVTYCGAPGAGQAMQLISHMLWFQNTVALAEAMVLVRHAGLDPKFALDRLAKGPADSYALRHPGMDSMLADDYPEKTFTSEHALKDIRYALRLAEEAGVFLSGADNAKEIIKKSIRAGHGKAHFAALARVIAGKGPKKKA